MKEMEQISALFSQRDDIAFAFLFGSQALGKATSRSDVDIAAYFFPRQRYPVEHQEEIYYPAEDDIWAALERILNKEVDFVVLNRAPATIAASVLRCKPLAINDWGLYLDFLLIVTSEAAEYRETLINDFITQNDCTS